MEFVVPLLILIMFIAKAGLLKTVTSIKRCYDKLVKEFVVNITADCNVSGSQEFIKVYVRGKCVKFSPVVINCYLGMSKDAVVVEDISFSDITNEINVGQVKNWP